MRTLERDEPALEALHEIRLRVQELREHAHDKVTSLEPDSYGTRAMKLWALHQARRDGIGKGDALMHSARTLATELCTSHPEGERRFFSATLAVPSLVLMTPVVFRPDVLDGPLGQECVRKASVLCQELVAELFDDQPPDRRRFQIGGVRAGEPHEPTAVVTNRCVRALLSSARALEDGSKLAKLVADTRKVLGRDRWSIVERERLELEALMEAAKPRSRFAGEGLDVPSGKDLGEHFRSSFQHLRNGLMSCEPPGKDKPATAQWWRQYAQTITADGAERHAERALRKSADLVVEGPLQCAKRYLAAVIDRELGRAQRNRRGECDAAELSFALAAYGSIEYRDGRRWDDPRIGAGVRVLEALISDEGRLPAEARLSNDDNNIGIVASGAEVLMAFAHVLTHAQVDASRATAQKMLRLFEATKVDDGFKPCFGRGATLWSTALAADALRALHKMLDAQINRRVLRHFTVTDAKQQKYRLSKLFYADHGLHGEQIGEETYESVALKLQRICAHVLGRSLPRSTRGGGNHRWYSMVLYGPPGTGKTTLAEGLAGSAQAPLVSISPSDFLRRGDDQIEARARTVFGALSKLTGCVILFDECDELVRDRDQASETIVRLLSPGMLTKLKALHSAAEKQRLAYFLATNLMQNIEAAAVREGRFDHRVCVLPPDPEARRGQLRHQWAQWSYERKPQELDGARLERVIKHTKHITMSAANRPGWLRRPEGAPPAGSLFDYLLHGGELPPVPVEITDKWRDGLKTNGHPLEKAAWAALEKQERA